MGAHRNTSPLLKGSTMFARFFAPLLITGLMLACTTDLPLEAQRARGAAQVGNPLTFTGEVARIANSEFGSLDGTLAITHLSVDADGNLLASGTIEGNVQQPGVLTSFSETFTDIPVTFTQSVPHQCVSIEIQLAPATVGGYDWVFHRQVLWRSIVGSRLIQDFCNLASGDRSASLLASVNAVIGA